ncbi:MAG: hypothetical protein J5965_02420 [Aeriscardovia sp.]|nr:hypothetical protein [Aeriscardovia sp.]
MTKTLRVIEPFFVMELGDMFEYSEDSKMYVSVHNEDFYNNDNDSSVESIKSSYSSEFQISPDYAKTLIKEGYLEEVSEAELKTPFVNIFDEIDSLLTKYNASLKTVEKDMADLPACIRVERQTVLTNMITLLEHLKSLKK